MEKDHIQSVVEKQTLIDELSIYVNQMYGVLLFLFWPKNRDEALIA